MTYQNPLAELLASEGEFEEAEAVEHEWEEGDCLTKAKSSDWAFDAPKYYEF
jgi:hypothetical protein